MMAGCKFIIALKTLQSKVTNNKNIKNEDLRSRPPRKWNTESPEIFQQVSIFHSFNPNMRIPQYPSTFCRPRAKHRKNSLGKRKSGCILDSARADNALHSRAGDERTGGNTGGSQGQNEQSFLHHLAGFSEK
jgi:hypothetical protein